MNYFDWLLPAMLAVLLVFGALQVQTPDATFTWLPVLVIALWGTYYLYIYLVRRTRMRYLERRWPSGLPPR